MIYDLSSCIMSNFEHAASVTLSPNVLPFQNDPFLQCQIYVDNGREKRRTIEGKRPTSMTPSEHDALPVCIWQAHHKNIDYFINPLPVSPSLFKHLLIHAACEMHRTLNSRCEKVVSIVNEILHRHNILGKVSSRPRKPKDLAGCWCKTEVEKSVNEKFGTEDMERHCQGDGAAEVLADHVNIDADSTRDYVEDDAIKLRKKDVSTLKNRTDSEIWKNPTANRNYNAVERQRRCLTSINRVVISEASIGLEYF